MLLTSNSAKTRYHPSYLHCEHRTLNKSEKISKNRFLFSTINQRTRNFHGVVEIRNEDQHIL